MDRSWRTADDIPPIKMDIMVPGPHLPHTFGRIPSLQQSQEYVRLPAYPGPNNNSYAIPHNQHKMSIFLKVIIFTTIKAITKVEVTIAGYP